MEMRTSAMCTDAPIGLGHGGGASSYYELEALRAKTNVSQIVQSPDTLGNYPNDPFFKDYLAAATVQQSVDVAWFNGSPWGMTMKMLGAGLNIVDCPAHKLSESIEEMKLCGMCYPYKHQYDEFLWPIYSQHLRWADIIVTQAAQSIGYLEELGIEDATRKSVVIPGGCVLPETVNPVPQDEFRVLYCGAIGSDKGVRYLIEAWIQMQSKGRLIMAGGNTDMLKAQLARYGNIDCYGRLPNLGEVYDCASVYVQPSVTEGFGLTVLEAMAHGRPVIVSKGAGCHEIIEDGIEGIKVHIRDVQAIADAIEYLRDNPGKAQEMGMAARLKAEQYTWDRAQRSYEDLLS